MKFITVQKIRMNISWNFNKIILIVLREITKKLKNDGIKDEL